MNLGNLSPNKGANKQRKRVGRGPGSGHGKTAGRGHKGFKARSGSGIKPGFEGGQMPLQRRLPKRGFTNINTVKYSLVSLDHLDLFEAGSEVTSDVLIAKGIARKGRPVKILANGELNKAITVNVEKISTNARTKIEAAGGKVVDPKE
ncbi:MAG: 50S ribosomal protein L15 [Proteobacteria bacterium]|nr:50S ribosomal protein L15 [Pseudomonadota bacterium]MBU1060956.1 50S ribosomal protein L15 [Pseudomonadota bacterium]